MKEKLVQFIICPKCSNNLSLKSTKIKDDEILEGSLICSKNHRFPIKGGIPRLVVDNAKTFVKTEDSFSSKWKNYNKTYHSKKWFDGQKKWFLERFGWKTVFNFNKFLKTRTRILDAGTGVGNSAKLFSSNPKGGGYPQWSCESRW